MSVYVAELGSTVTLALVIQRAGVGGITALAPTVAIRDAIVPTLFLDWADNTFKSAGWTLKHKIMTDAGGGRYTQSLNLALITTADQTSQYSAEYAVDNGGDVKGVAMDDIFLTRVEADTRLIARIARNRLEESPGNPGVLVLYDDDNATPLLTWQVRDFVGGATVGAPGVPARRSRGV